MSLSIGITGLPNVGKSTLFNALTDADALIANYPFATIEPNTGSVPIPDPRLQKLAKIYKTDKIVPATVTFVDIAGLVAGSSQGEGLGNQFLSHIRATFAICHVVRAFDDPNVTRVSDTPHPKGLHLGGVQGADEKRTEPYMEYGEGAAQSATPQSAKSTSGAAGSASRQAGVVQGLSGPKNDIEIVNTELILADLQTVDKRLPRLEKEMKADPKLKPIYDNLLKVKDLLESGTKINDSENINFEYLTDLFLLTAKPTIYVFNIDEPNLNNLEFKNKLIDLVKPEEAIFICAKLENELRGLDEADRKELLDSYGQAQSGLEQLIYAAYQTLGLQSFLTAGQVEVRAWTIPAGATAPQAAGTIHGDFERGFIAAQAINYDDLINAGSVAAARSAGKVRTEGKTYLMQPDDVVEFRFNV